MTEKKKCTQSTDCKNGKHTFMVTEWMTRGGHQVAIEIRCRHCLMPMSLEELRSSEWRKAEGV